MSLKYKAFGEAATQSLSHCKNHSPPTRTSLLPLIFTFAQIDPGLVNHSLLPHHRAPFPMQLPGSHTPPPSGQHRALSQPCSHLILPPRHCSRGTQHTGVSNQKPRYSVYLPFTVQHHITTNQSHAAAYQKLCHSQNQMPCHPTSLPRQNPPIWVLGLLYIRPG